MGPGKTEFKYEVGFTITYNCTREGYEYTGDVLECVVQDGNVTWNNELGSCVGMCFQ